jgi:hypothetical protein
MGGIVTDLTELTDGLSNTDDSEWYILSGSAAFTRTRVRGITIRGPFVNQQGVGKIYVSAAHPSPSFASYILYPWQDLEKEIPS